MAFAGLVEEQLGDFPAARSSVVVACGRNEPSLCYGASLRSSTTETSRAVWIASALRMMSPFLDAAPVPADGGMGVAAETTGAGDDYGGGRREIGDRGSRT